MPFRRFEQRKFLRYDRDVAYLRFVPALWRQLKPEDRAAIGATCATKIDTYYDRLTD